MNYNKVMYHSLGDADQFVFRRKLIESHVHLLGNQRV